MPTRLRITLALLMTVLCLSGAAIVGGLAHRPTAHLAATAPPQQLGQGAPAPPVSYSESEPSHD
jgi:hypothetical protein